MIHIIDDFYINVSDKTYILAEYKGEDKNGNPSYAIIGYYTDIKSAIKQCVRCIFARNMTDETKELYDAIDMLKLINKDLERKLEEVSE